MAQQDIRYYLNGLLLVVNGAEMRVVATDGHRLAFASEALPESLPRSEVILPRKTVLELSRQLADNDEPLEIIAHAEPGAVPLRQHRTRLQADRRQVPRLRARHSAAAHQGAARCDATCCCSRLLRAAILTNEKFRGVRLVLADGSLKIISTNAEQEEAQEEIEVDYQGDSLDVGFNVTYLLDVLNNICDRDHPVPAWPTPIPAPCSSCPDNERFKYVVMPMRI